MFQSSLYLLSLALFRVTAQVQICSFTLPSSKCFRESLGDVGDQRNGPSLKSLVVGSRVRECCKGYTALLLCHPHSSCPSRISGCVPLGERPVSLWVRCLNPPSYLYPGHPPNWLAPQSYARYTNRGHRRRLLKGRPPPAQPAAHAREDSSLSPTSYGGT